MRIWTEELHKILFIASISIARLFNMHLQHNNSPAALWDAAPLHRISNCENVQ